MKHRFNYILFFLVALMLVFSALFFACLSGQASLQRSEGENSYYFFLHQLLYAFLPAIICCAIAYKIPLDFLKKWSPLVVLLNLIALFLVFLPEIGLKAGGASRWLDLGLFIVQPSELLKITSIIYLSAWISSKLSEADVSDWKSATQKSYHNVIYILIPFLVFLGIISVGLILQRDASTMGIITLTLLALYFSAKTPFWHTLLIIAAGMSTLLFLVRFEQYRFDRFLIFLHPGTDPMGRGYQVTQQLISLGSGGMFGKGLGLSSQKFGYLPQAMTDSIFAIVGEELGFIGAFVLIVAFILFFWLGIQIAKNSRDRFSKMAAIGIVTWITLQAFINMASASGIFPLAGIPLPFFSFGGSHLAVELFAVGLLLNISKNN